MPNPEAGPSGGDVHAGSADSPSTPPVDPPLISIGPIGPGDVLRMPSFGDQSEQALAQANRRRRDRAASKVERLLGRSLETVLEPPDSESDGASPTTWVAPLPWADTSSMYEQVDGVIRHDDARPGRLTIDLETAQPGVTDGLGFDTTYALHRPSTNQIAATLAGGASVVVRAVGRHLDDVNELVAALETLLGAAIEADAILFGPGSTHVDAATRGGAVLIFALDVDVSATVSQAPVETDEATGPGTAFLDSPSINILAGSVATVSPNRALRLRAEEAGMALRIMLPVPTCRQLWTQAAAIARYHPLLRADLPTDLDAPIESYAGSLYERPGAFHAEIALAMGQTPIMHALASVPAQVPTRSCNGLFDNLRDSPDFPTTLRASIPGGIALTNADDQQVLVMGGMTVRIASELAPMLIPHLDGEPFNPAPIIDALAASPDVAQAGGPQTNLALEALLILLNAEILEVVP